SAVGERGIRSALELGLPLRSDVRSPGRETGGAAEQAADGPGGAGRELVAEVGLVARLAPGGAHLELVAGASPEGREAVGGRGLGVEEEPLHVPVAAGPLGTGADRQQQA